MKKYYAETHECLTVNDKSATLAISDFAIEQLGDIVFVELPEPGQEITCGENIIVVESVKAASDVYAPVSGVITEINETLTQNPEILNKLDPETGWLIRLELSNPEELNELMDEDSYNPTA